MEVMSTRTPTNMFRKSPLALENIVTIMRVSREYYRRRIYADKMLIESSSHCVGGSTEERNCNAPDRDYNIPLRVGLLFVILVTSGAGVFLPILTTRFNLISQNNIIFVILKQFGTGIVISTAFVHLFTHADLMFGNSCLGELQYEGTTAAIFMAGLFLSFVVDYLGARFVQWRQNKHAGTSAEVPSTTADDKSAGSSTSASPNNGLANGHGHAHGPMRAATPMEEKINVMNLEAGIIFHSIRKTSTIHITAILLTTLQLLASRLLSQATASSSPSSSSFFSTKCLKGLLLVLASPNFPKPLLRRCRSASWQVLLRSLHLLVWPLVLVC
jgi:hypothetical protein